MCKLCHKLRNSQNLPTESKSFRNIYFLINFPDNLGHFATHLRPHYQNKFFLPFLFCFLLKAPGFLETCVNCVINCVMPKRASVQSLHGQMKLDV